MRGVGDVPWEGDTWAALGRFHWLGTGLQMRPLLSDRLETSLVLRRPGRSRARCCMLLSLTHLWEEVLGTVVVYEILHLSY